MSDALEALKQLEAAVMRYGFRKERGDDEWVASLQGLFDALKQARIVIQSAEGAISAPPPEGEQ